MAKKNLGKRVLAAILSIVMCFSAAQIQVFADTEENHVMPGSFVLDENGNVTGTTNETTNSAHGFTVSKTAKQTGKNAFDITLRVQTSTTVVTDDAAIVLVVDASNSMNTGRLTAVKNALTKDGGFVESLSNNSGRVFLSVVVFNNGAYTVVDWTELNDTSKAGIKQSINGISCSTGTNLEAGLMLARNKLGQDAVASCGNKYTVLLSDGAPSKWMDRDSSSTSTISSGINSALSEGHAETISGSREMAAAVKALSTLYTICYGASNNQLVDGQEICAHCEKEEDDHIDLCQYCQKTRNEHNRSGSRRYCSGNSGTTYKAASYCDASGENKYEAKTVNGMTVGQFLANEVATAPAYAYDADDEAAVNAAFSAVATSASSGMTGAGTTVTDPMGQFIVLGDVSSLSTVTAAGNALTWNLDESTLVDTSVSGNTTTYTYEITYPITLDTAAEGFEEKDENGETRYYPTNKYTYLSVVTDNGTVKIPFNVPGVSGTVPMIPYSVEYYLQGNATAGAYDQYTLNATQEMPAVKAWTVGSAPAEYADKYSTSNYSFAYGEPTVQVIPEGENVIKLYYNRDLAEVTVNHFYKTDVINALGQVTSGTYPTAPQATATQKAYVGDAYQAELALNYGGHTYVLESADPAQSLTVSAEGGNVINLYYTRNTYTYSYGVVYDGNGGQLALGATTYNDDENLSETDKTSHIIKVDVNTFARPNYEFIGWSDSPKGDVIFSAGDSIEFTATGTKTLYAQWKAIPYNVSYEYVGTVPANAPALPAGSTHIVGENVTVAGNPTLVNYTFSGWTTSDAAIADGSFVMPGKDVKLVGSWTAIPYNVSYEYVGTIPANAPALPAGSTHIVGENVAVSGNPTLANYTFSGWTTSDAEIADGSFVMPGKDVKLVGSWTAIPYSVTYVYTGNVPANAPALPAGGTFYAGDKVTVAAEAVLEHYTFSGWSTGHANVENGSFVRPGNDVILEGSWTEYDKYSYAVNYYGNGGVLENDETWYGDSQNAQNTYTNPYTIYVDENTFVREHYQFVGWTEEPNGNVVYKAGDGIGFTASGTKTLYAKWKAIPYNVSYEYVGTVPANTPAVPAGSTHVVGENVTVAGNPTVANYTFSGWTTADADVINGSFAMPGKDVKLVGSWTENPKYGYTLTYVGNGGKLSNNETTYNDSQSVTAIYNTTYAMSADSNTFERSTYRFIGWNTQADGKGVSYAAGDEITFTVQENTKTLYAQWEAIAYNVTYVYTGKVPVGVPALPAGATYIAGSKVAVAQNAALEGYIFSGWTTADAVIADGSFVMPGQDVVLEGSWVARPVYDYTVVYNANFGETPATKADEQNAQRIYDAAYTIDVNSNSFVRENYTFIGWAAEANGDVVYQAGDQIHFEKGGAKVLYARWIENDKFSYTVIYNGNGGALKSGELAYGDSENVEQTYATAHQIRVDGNSFLRANYTFIGWNTAADGTGTAYTAEEIIKLTSEDNTRTLYAQWKENAKYAYELIYNANFGETPATKADEENVAQIYATSYKITVNENTFVRDNYTFIGWNTAADGTGTAYAAGSAVALTAEKNSAVLYAQWKENPKYAFELTYNANFGEAPETSADEENVAQTYATSHKITVNENAFVREHYTFIGWNTAADGTGTAYKAGSELALTVENNTAVLYAQWEINEYEYVVEYKVRLEDAAYEAFTGELPEGAPLGGKLIYGASIEAEKLQLPKALSDDEYTYDYTTVEISQREDFTTVVTVYYTAELVDIPNEEPPLADVPETGDASIFYTVLTTLSGLGLATLALKKKEETEE